MTTAYPILLEPLLKARVWGGRGLERLGKRLPAGEMIGESWEVADLPESVEDGRSVIANGPLAGHTLREALDAEATMILGAAHRTAEGGFPLLIKYLDARENLSVQVHPTPEYVAAHPGTHVKNEAWLVLDAEPGAVIYRGLRPGVDRDAFASLVESGAIVDHLATVPALPGSCHHLPSGTVHALGAGIVVAEVQTPSDTTFRVFDWNRGGRTLHVQEALACIDFENLGPEVPPVVHPIQAGGILTTPLLDTASFAIERIERSPGSDSSPVELRVVTNGLPVVWMTIGGAGRIRAGGHDVDLRPGTTVLLPATADDALIRLATGGVLLRATPPSTVHGLIA